MRSKRRKKVDGEKCRNGERGTCCARMKEGKRLCDEGAEEVNGSAPFATCEQERRTTFITSSHWKRGAVHQIIHCAKMQIQIPLRELRPYSFFFILLHPFFPSFPSPLLFLSSSFDLLLHLLPLSLLSAGPTLILLLILPMHTLPLIPSYAVCFAILR